MSSDEDWTAGSSVKPKQTNQKTDQQSNSRRGRGRGNNDTSERDQTKSPPEETNQTPKVESNTDSQSKKDQIDQGSFWGAKKDPVSNQRDTNKGGKEAGRQQSDDEEELEPDKLNSLSIFQSDPIDVVKEGLDVSLASDPVPSRGTGRGNRDSGDNNAAQNGNFKKNKGVVEGAEERGERGNREERGNVRGNRQDGGGNIRGNRQDGGNARGNREDGGNTRGSRQDGGNARGNRQDGGNARGNREDGGNNYRGNRQGGRGNRGNRDGAAQKTIWTDQANNQFKGGNNWDRGNNNDRDRKPWGSDFKNQEGNYTHRGEGFRSNNGGQARGRGRGYNQGNNNRNHREQGSDTRGGYGRGNREDRGNNGHQNQFRDTGRQGLSPRSQQAAQSARIAEPVIPVVVTPKDSQVETIPVGLRSWPSVSLYMAGCHVSIQLRRLQSIKGDVITIPFQTVELETYPGHIVNSSQFDYRKKLSKKIQDSQLGAGTTYVQLWMGRPANFKVVAFLMYDSKAIPTLDSAVKSLIKYCNHLNSGENVTKTKEQIKAQRVILPISREFCSAKIILQALGKAIEKHKVVKEIILITEDKAYFEDCIGSYSDYVSSVIKQNRMEV